MDPKNETDLENSLNEAELKSLLDKWQYYQIRYKRYYKMTIVCSVTSLLLVICLICRRLS